MFYTLDELLSAGEKDTIECKSSMYFCNSGDRVTVVSSTVGLCVLHPVKQRVAINISMLCEYFINWLCTV